MRAYLPAIRLAFPLLFALGCLEPADLTPSGYGCESDADCGGGLLCFQAVCGESIRPVLSYSGPTGNQYVLFESEESDALLASGFTSDGPLLKASIVAGPAFAPVFRLRNPTNLDFLLTPFTSERDSAVSLYGYVDEGIAFYAYPYQGTAGVVMHRLVKGYLRKYVVGEEKRAEAVAAGWTYEFQICRGDAP